jgi:hypothetical protein
MSANTDKCADKDKAFCDYNEFRRLRYFHGMLLDDKDFQAEQQYHAGKRRLLNRMLYGSGVVCGLEIKGKKDARWIEITSGFALDCSGNEIWVPKTEQIDLAKLLPPKDQVKNNGKCRPEDEKDQLKTYYIGIRYNEQPTNPVSVYLPSGSCEEKSCENSRYKEGFCVEVVECCEREYDPGLWKTFCDCDNGAEPDKVDLMCHACGDNNPNSTTNYSSQNANANDTKNVCKCVKLEQFCESSVECAECCSCEKACHVILGQIKVDDECKLQSICLNECRQYVLTGRLLQHVLLGVFAGSEEFFSFNVNGQSKPIPSFAELAHNPIKALCTFLQRTVVEGGEFEQLDCRKTPKPTEQPKDETVRSLQTRLETLSTQQAVLLADLKTLRDLHTTQGTRLEAIEKAGAVVDPNADKGQTPSKKK